MKLALEWRDMLTRLREFLKSTGAACVLLTAIVTHTAMAQAGSPVTSQAEPDAKNGASVQPSEAQPVEAQPDEAQPAEAQPAEAQPSEVEPNQTSQDKPQVRESAEKEFKPSEEINEDQAVSFPVDI